MSEVPDPPFLREAYITAQAAVTARDGEIARLRAALKPFADCAEQIREDESDEEWAKFRLLTGDYRRAKAALLPSISDGDSLARPTT